MADLILQPLPYFRDSSHLMRLFAQKPYAVFLDSGLTDQPNARHDILSALPSAHKLVSAGDVLLNPFESARELLATFSLLPSHYAQLAHLPFCGGLLGCIAYDAGMPQAGSVKAAASSPGTVPVAAFGVYDWAIIVDHQNAETVLFILPQCPADIREQVTDLLNTLTSGGEVPATSVDDFALKHAFRPLMDRSEYLRAFDKLQQYILAGDCYQSNLAIPFSASYQGAIESAYLLLRARSRSPFSAFVGLGDVAILSLSPERFISVRDSKVLTQPIKGTRKRVADPHQDQANRNDLLRSEKDRAENLMIVDLLRNDLGRICITGSVQTGPLFQLFSFSHVHHLVSTVSGQLPPHCSPLQLLEQCFPGGSITGAPKIRAMQIIAELESMPRSFYCGSVFYCDYLRRMDSNICIRTLVADGSRLFCWGGSGVVADSVADDEHQECLDKVSALMDLPQA